MFRPPLDPRDRPLIDQPTWQSILASYASIAAVPLLLWVISQPLAGAVTLGAIAGLFICGRRVNRLIDCFYDCQEFAFDIGGKAQITIAQIPIDEAN